MYGSMSLVELDDTRYIILHKKLEGVEETDWSGGGLYSSYKSTKFSNTVSQTGRMRSLF